MYQFKVLSTWWLRVIQKVLIALLWFIYPMLMWVPLRGAICLLIIVEPQLKPIFMSTLQTIHSMDINSDEPVYYSKPEMGVEKLNSRNSEVELPSYALWLDSGMEGRPFLQRLLAGGLQAQLLSSAHPHWSSARILPWVRLAAESAMLIVHTIWRHVLDTIACWKTQIKESIIFNGDEVKIPRHIGFVMDGNYWYDRSLGGPVIFGDQHETQIAHDILRWWLRFMPNIAAYTHPGSGAQCLTIWRFSAEDFKRPKEELDALFRLMTVEFKSLAFTPLVHLFQIRVRVVGNRKGLPQDHLDAVELLEGMTAKYSRLFLQIVVGNGTAQGILVGREEDTEGSFSERTFFSQSGIPSLDLVIRMSEHSEYLWDTRTAEVHFPNRHWSQFTQGNWLDALASFSRREMRSGK
ncbi:hypothetical protein GALMADRAFT_935964 [Galerina marginata CBS 339.88]|uniref:Uncharacterized protein n=1 Tax=Galerina marginata (strain CBS 339.88) TaxID=685588 RepID=A0A067SPZ0_GALM3|nr:hypothetical protein GALMADRAFT_935964 [Galerina marginata CBS 339.88]